MVTKHDIGCDTITKDDLIRLYRTVARLCPAGTGPTVVEDLVGDMVLDASVASQKTGIPITPLAFQNAKRPRYYARGAGRAGSLRDFTEQYAGPFAATADSAARSVVDEELADPFDMIAALEIDDLLARMTESVADAITLHLREDLKLVDTAQRLGVTTNAAFVRVQKGKTILADAINAALAA